MFSKRPCLSKLEKSRGKIDVGLHTGVHTHAPALTQNVYTTQCTVYFNLARSQTLRVYCLALIWMSENYAISVCPTEKKLAYKYNPSFKLLLKMKI